jgi:hypothetical protein
MDRLLANWKTSVAMGCTTLGILFSAAGAYFDADPTTNPNWQMVVMAVGALITALNTKDA